MKKVKYLFLILLFPLTVFAGGSHGKNYQTKPVYVAPAPATPNPPIQPPAPPQPSNPPTTPVAAPVGGGGWNGGCSTYSQGNLPPWGVVPCNPTSPTQPHAVTPTGLSPYPTSIPMSALPYTGLRPSLWEYLWYLLVGWM